MPISRKKNKLIDQVAEDLHLRTVIRKEEERYKRWAQPDYDPYRHEKPSDEEIWQSMVEKAQRGEGALGPAPPLGPPGHHGPLVPLSRAARSRANPPRAPDAPPRFRVPEPGDIVTVAGTRLNGHCGQVLAGGADEEGFVRIRLTATETTPSFAAKDVKVRLDRLRPLEASRSASNLDLITRAAAREAKRNSPPCHDDYIALPDIGDWASVRTCSSAVGSVAGVSSHQSQFSRASSRRSGSTGVLSMSWYSQRKETVNPSHQGTAVIL